MDKDTVVKWSVLGGLALYFGWAFWPRSYAKYDVVNRTDYSTGRYDVDPEIERMSRLLEQVQREAQRRMDEAKMERIRRGLES